MAEKKGIDEALLEGLVFRDATVKKVKDEATGRTREVSTPFERKLTPDDVMSFREDGTKVVIATTDGQKYTVERKGKK